MAHRLALGDRVLSRPLHSAPGVNAPGASVLVPVPVEPVSNGKGSARRGTDKASDAAYRAGWDAIFGAKNTKRVHKTTKCVQPRWLKGQVALDKLAEVTRAADYPSWVCSDCATKAGGKLRGDSATYHTGDCEVCGITQWVTQPRDYGYPKFE